MAFVNVAIGLNVNDFASVIKEHQREQEELKNQVNQTHAIFSELVPGFNEAANMNNPTLAMFNLSISIRNARSVIINTCSIS